MTPKINRTPLPPLDSFTRGYLEAALWAECLPPFGRCPECGVEDKALDRWSKVEHGRHVCGECSDQEPNYDPPADRNYSLTDFAPETFARAIADCAQFQAEHSDDIGEFDIASTHDPDKWRGYEFAGHNFWLSRNGHGAGFFDRDAGEVGERLQEAARGWGECSLYVGDDGKIYVG